MTNCKFKIRDRRQRGMALPALAATVLAASTAASGAPAAEPAGTAEEVGRRIYQGEASAGTCVACHGADGEGTPMGPALNTAKMLWSDGSPDGIARVITNGIANPRQFAAAMPPMGGAQLSPAQIQAIAIYISGLSSTKR